MVIHAISNMVVCFELLIKKNKHIVNIVFCPTLILYIPKQKLNRCFLLICFLAISLSVYRHFTCLHRLKIRPFVGFFNYLYQKAIIWTYVIFFTWMLPYHSFFTISEWWNSIFCKILLNFYHDSYYKVISNKHCERTIL